MTEYPKIETLLDRDTKTFKVIEGKIRLPEFQMIEKWRCTEKIDGTNIRISYNGKAVEICGRTENAQMPTFLLSYLQQVFTAEKFKVAFPDLKDGEEVVVYGEGYGPKIQSGGNYRKDISVRLFDVKVGKWWLEPENIEDIANKLGVKTVPTISDFTIEQAVAFVKTKPLSQVANQEGGNPAYPMEGIVARTTPLLLRRNGERLIWKLKHKDFKL